MSRLAKQITEQLKAKQYADAEKSWDDLESAVFQNSNAVVRCSLHLLLMLLLLLAIFFSLWWLLLLLLFGILTTRWRCNCVIVML